jgi:hypothetical protein
MHVASSRPGRAVALCDITWMLEHQRFRITSGNMAAPSPDSAAASAAGDSAAAAADSGPRALSPAELRAIENWLAVHRAETPSGAAEIRAAEVFLMPGAYRGRGGPPLAPRFPPKRRESLGPSSAPGIPLQPPPSSVLDSFRGTRFSRHPPPDRRSDHCIRPT